MANDFHNFIGRRLSDEEKFEALKSHRVLPSSFKLRTRLEYGKQRSFNQTWLNEYKWIKYSPDVDGVYCKYCALFSDSDKIDKLVKTPLCFWTIASQKFKKHSESDGHKRASVLANNFIKLMISKQQGVDVQLNTTVAMQISSNRLKLYPIIQTILFCGQQNIPLRRGHREDISSTNPGNFKALLKFRVEAEDNLLKNHLETSAKNARYTSKVIQDDIINVIGEYIQGKILSEVQEGSKVFSIIADEARDISNKEQMSLIVRYVDSHPVIHESFIAFVECNGTSGEDIANLIETKCVNTLKLDMNMCRGQGYDGAGNMAGHCSGAAKLIAGLRG